jgi:cell division protein FtsZ
MSKGRSKSSKNTGARNRPKPITRAVQADRAAKRKRQAKQASEHARGGESQMSKRSNGNGTSGGSRRGQARDQHDSVDLLEIGPDDGQDLLEFEGSSHQRATIKVIGVGGGGGNALNTMIASGLAGVEFIAANTDAQALKHNLAPVKLQLGVEVTRGLGCGANPDRGRASALEARDRLRELLEGSDMVFVTAGMGGGTGTGAAPIVAEVAREIGALTVGVVTKPFLFEGKVRTRHGERGIDELHEVVDTLITIPNQRLLALAGKGTGMKDAFKLADDVLLNAVRGISDLITVHGLINLDFADVRTVMNEAGVALMGSGVGSGETGATDAARAAISSPLLEDLSIDGARGVLINVTGGNDMTLFEVSEASVLIQEAAHEDANIIFGAVIDETMPEGEMRVTVIATGLDDDRGRRAPLPEDRDHTAVEVDSVGRPQREPVPVHTGPTAPAASSQALRQTEIQPMAVAAGGDEVPITAQELGGGAEFASPFEDELDTPAFLRRRVQEN